MCFDKLLVPAVCRVPAMTFWYSWKFWKVPDVQNSTKEDTWSTPALWSLRFWELTSLGQKYFWKINSHQHICGCLFLDVIKLHLKIIDVNFAVNMTWHLKFIPLKSVGQMSFSQLSSEKKRQSGVTVLVSITFCIENNIWLQVQSLFDSDWHTCNVHLRLHSKIFLVFQS